MVIPESSAKNLCSAAIAEGDGSWAMIVLEELCEAIEAKTFRQAEQEVIQLAAVCLRWIEHLRSAPEMNDASD